VSGDQVQLRQVLLNLIANAIDAMAQENGARVLHVRSTVCESDSVMVSVEDTGRGIEPAHIEHIFSPHFTTKSHGMGLGLSICRSIIEGHGAPVGCAEQPTRSGLSVCAARKQRASRRSSRRSSALPERFDEACLTE
jgi:C4-dicarboxylate-specific signal transduction histidine kinase